MSNTQYKEEIIKMLNRIDNSRVLKQIYEIVRTLKGVVA